MDDVDGRTPTEEQGHRFDAKAGRYPLLRWQSEEFRQAMGEIAGELDVRSGSELAAELDRGRILLLDSGVRLRATTAFRDPETGTTWRTLSELRRGAMLNTGKLLRERDHELDDRERTCWIRADEADPERIGTEYELTQAGRFWSFDPVALRDVVDEHASSDFDFDFKVPTEGRRARFVQRLRSLGRRAPTVDPFRWRAFSGTEWVTVAVRMEMLAHAADAYDLQPLERLALARRGRVRTPPVGRDLVQGSAWDRTLYMVGPGSALRMTFGERTILLGPGSITGFQSLDHVIGRKSPERPRHVTSVTVVSLHGAQSGLLVEWDSAAMRQLNGTSLLGGGWFARFMQQRQDLYDHGTEIVDALAADPLFDGVDPGHLAALLPGASTIRWAVGGPPPVPVGMAPGLVVLLDGDVVGYKLLPAIEDGTVRDLRLAPTHGYQVREGEHRPVIGRLDTALTVIDGDNRRSVDAQLRARLPSHGVFLYARRFERILGRQRRFRENCAAVVAHHHQVQAHRAVLGALDERQDQFHDVLNVMFVGRAHSDGVLPLRASDEEPDLDLIEALTEDIHTRFQERSAIVELVRPGGRAVERFTHPCREHLTVEIATGATNQDYDEALRALSDELVQRRDVVHVFIWSQRPWPGSFAGAADSVMLLSFDPQAPVPTDLEPDNTLLYAQLVPAAAGVILPPGAVRLQTLQWERPKDGWISAREARGRWARSVTQRRVGVALGGGGAWGWAHMALLRAMENNGVPVDMVSGASFGAVAGAVYAVAGKSGLTWAVEEAPAIKRAVNSAMLHGARAEGYFDDLAYMMLGWAGRHWEDDVRSFGGTEADHQEIAELFSRIGHPAVKKLSGAFESAEVDDDEDAERRREQQLRHWRRLVHNLRPAMYGLTDATEREPLLLQRLPIPFFPVITELVAGSQSVILDRSVGFGVRASGALPPLFPVTRDQTRTYADGGLSQNVPANVVDLEGAALIVASNIVPPSLLRGPMAEGRWERLTDLNPVQRAIAAAVGVQTLFSSAGQVDTGLAPVVFQTTWNGKMFFSLDKGAEIVKDTYSVRSFWQAMDGLVDRWEQLRKPRRRDDPIALG